MIGRCLSYELFLLSFFSSEPTFEFFELPLQFIDLVFQWRFMI